MESKHTIESPLKLTWTVSGYKVNKPDQGNQELVSLEYAVAIIREHQLMKEALDIIAEGKHDYPVVVAKETLKQITL